MPEKRGALEQYDDTSKLAVSLYGKDTAAGDKSVGVDGVGDLYTVIRGDDVITAVDVVNVNDQPTISGRNALSVNAYPRLTDGSTWQYFWNNAEVTLLASAARTSTTNSSDQTNYNARGIIAFLDVTAAPGVDTVTLLIQGKDSVSGNYRTLAASAAKDATGTYYVVCYPGSSDVGNKTDGKNDVPLPRTWRVQVLHSGSGSFTYSVGASLIL